MFKTMLTSASAFALIMTAATANQQDDMSATPKYEPATAPSAMSAIDVTTREEAAKLADWQFAIADANADGAVDADEFSAFVAADAQAAAGQAPIENAEPADKAFAAIARTDKKISKEELAEARAKSFDKADANGDQSLDALEQQRFAALVTAKPAGAKAQ